MTYKLHVIWLGSSERCIRGAATTFLSTNKYRQTMYHCPQVGAWKYPFPGFCYFPWYMTATRSIHD